MRERRRGLGAQHEDDRADVARLGEPPQSRRSATCPRVPGVVSMRIVTARIGAGNPGCFTPEYEIVPNSPMS